MRDGLLKQFGESQVSALISTVVDFCFTALVFRLTDSVVVSTFSGALVGGCINCIANYLWTFRGTANSKRSVAGRYAVVWAMSLAFNTFGTDGLVRLATLLLPRTLNMVVLCRVVVALAVAIAWNFPLQKYFVYKK